MAHGSGASSALSMRRSTQSGTKAMTAAWQVLYIESCSQAMYFAAGIIDLTNMAAGDTVNIRVEKVVAPAGNWIVHDYMSYSNAQPANHRTAAISGMPDVYGIRISAQQTAVAAALLNLDCEFFDAKRLGIV